MNSDLKRKYEDLMKTAKILNEVKSTVNNTLSSKSN